MYVARHVSQVRSGPRCGWVGVRVGACREARVTRLPWGWAGLWVERSRTGEPVCVNACANEHSWCTMSDLFPTSCIMRPPKLHKQRCDDPKACLVGNARATWKIEGHWSNSNAGVG